MKGTGFGPFLVMVAGTVAAIALSVGFTLWAISSHSRQSCPEVQIIATAKGADTAFDQTVKSQYAALYRLRCR